MISDDFDGTKPILLRPDDANLPYSVEMTVCTAKKANNGVVPFGRTIASVDVTSHKDTPEGDVDATAELIQAFTLNGFVVELVLSWPSGTDLEEGIYHIKFLLTFDNASTKQVNFYKVYCRED